MMGNNNTTYKVLWVTECDGSTVNSSKKDALTNHQLELIDFSNWDDAEADLNKNFKDYSAIILDPQCKLHSNKNKNDISSLMVILSQLREIFALRYDAIAWYILAFGEKIPEQETVEEIRNRMSLNDDWGKKMVYDVNSQDDEGALFAQIKAVAERRYQNSVLYKHKDALLCLGDKTTIDFQGAKEDLVKTLAALYDPQNFKLEYAKDYKDYANMLRRILECMFMSALKMGLLPIECFHNREANSPNLKYSFNYMAGFVVHTKHYGDIRWGKQKKDIGGVFSPEDTSYLDDMLNYFSRFSHYQDTDKIDKELFFSYTMRLCHIIRRFDDYVRKNSAPNINYSHKHKINKNTADDGINTKAKLDVYASGKQKVYYIGPCKIEPDQAFSSMVGRTFIVEKAKLNKNGDKKYYPFIATKIRPSIFVQDKFRVTVVGETFNVTNDLSIDGNDYYFKGNKYLEDCKLSSGAINEIKANSNVMNWKIDEEADSDEIDSWKYPRLVTKVSPAP